MRALTVAGLELSSKRFAYLVYGEVPPVETMRRLEDLDFVILEAMVDALLPEQSQAWMDSSLQQAIDCWKRIVTEECILTHLSRHSCKAGKFVAGFSDAERLKYEAANVGLKFAYDGILLAV